MRPSSGTSGGGIGNESSPSVKPPKKSGAPFGTSWTIDGPTRQREQPRTEKFVRIDPACGWLTLQPTAEERGG